MCYIWNVHRRGQAVSSYPRCIMRAGNRSQVVLPGGPSPGAGFIKGIAAFIRMPPPDAGGGERKANRLPWGGKEPRLYASVMLNGERQQCKRGRNPPDAPGLSDGFFHRVNLLSNGAGRWDCACQARPHVHDGGFDTFTPILDMGARLSPDMLKGCVSRGVLM